MIESGCTVWARLMAVVLVSVFLLVAADKGRAEDMPPMSAQEEAADIDPESRIGRFEENTRVSEDEYEFSQAERLLWLSDHMTHAEIVEGVTLHYTFTRDSILGDGFEDDVQMKIQKVRTDGSEDVRVKFFRGSRQQPVFYPENLNGVRGNPVLGIYLQGDVHDMHRMTEGSWRYFQRLIKLALAGKADVDAIELQYQGRSIQAQRITIRPYDDDPKKARYLKFADKSYEFVLSDVIPGVLYSIHSVTLNPGTGEKVVEERLLFSDLRASSAESS